MTFDLNRSEDQRRILDAADGLLDQSYPLSRLRTSQSDDLGPLAAFGAFSLALPEETGGAGFSAVEEALVHVALGRHVVTTRALATALAARLALSLSRADLASRFADGSLAACAAVRDGDAILLFESAGAGDGAGPALLFDGRELALVEPDTARAERLPGLGHGPDVLRVADSSATVPGRTGDAGMLAAADLLVSAQLLGIAEATRDLAVAYAQVRHQFGRPIGAFQAIKHRCADMALAAEAASSLLDFAAVAVAEARADAPFQVAALRRLAARAALENARACIQIHGGIGFSAEADAHHFLKRAHLLSRLGGAPALLDLPAPLAPHRTVAERS